MASETFINKLRQQFAPLDGLLSRIDGSTVTTDTEVLISHRPAIGSEAYAITLYAPVTASEIAKYEQIAGLAISPHYASVLRSVNGAHVFELSLYGIPRSMLSNPALLNRSARQPLDLATANRFWRTEYKAPRELFHFGGGALSYDENVGYFFDAVGAVHALRKSGDTWDNWPSFTDFLSAEVVRLERAFPAFEAFMADANRPAR